MTDEKTEEKSEKRPEKSELHPREIQILDDYASRGFTDCEKSDINYAKAYSQVEELIAREALKDTGERLDRKTKLYPTEKI